MSFCLISWSVQGFIFSSEKFLINWKCPPQICWLFDLSGMAYSFNWWTDAEHKMSECKRHGGKIDAQEMTWVVRKMTWAVWKVRSGLKSTKSILWYCSNGLRYHVNWVDNEVDASPHITTGQLHLVDHHMKCPVGHHMNFQKLKACPLNLSFRQSKLFSGGLI